jgi:hypothetical protein
MELTEIIAAQIIIESLIVDYPNGVHIKNLVADKYPIDPRNHSFRRIVAEKLMEYKLAEPAGDQNDHSLLKLTRLGNETFSKMTLAEYEEKIKKDQEKKKTYDELSLEKLSIDLKNAKRVYQTYWWTFGIAVAGFIISIVLLILRFADKPS